MRHTRKRCYFSNLKLAIILLMLVCFETRTLEQPFVKCLHRKHHKETAWERQGPTADAYRLWNFFHKHADPMIAKDKRSNYGNSWSWDFDAKVKSSSTQSESDDDTKRKTRSRHLEKLSSNCSCPWRAWFEREEVKHKQPTPCRIHWDKVVLLNRRVSHETGQPQTKQRQMTNFGKRYQKLRSTAWSVDMDVNYKGQAKRNSMKLQKMKVKVLSMTSKGHSAKGQRSIKDHLLMSDYQRKGSAESGWGSIILRLLVSLATISLLLGDLSRRQEMEGDGSAKGRPLNLLLLPGECTLNGPDNVNSNKGQHKKAHSDYFSGELGHHNQSCSVKWDILHSVVLDSQRVGTTSLRPPQEWWVFPATGFFPTQTSNSSHFLDYEAYRLASLAALPSSSDVSRIRLAEAGFHYDPRNTPSAVLCHRCRTTLSLASISTEGQSAFNYHWSQSPNCPLLVAMHTAGPRTPAAQRREGADRSDGRDLSEDGDGIAPVSSGRRQSLPNSQSLTRPTGEPVAPALTTSNTYQPSTTEGDPHQAEGPAVPRGDNSHQLDLGHAVYPQFSTIQSRRATFENWTLGSRSPQFSPDRLVTLGFFFAGYADCVRCFYCGVGLKSWEENDDPLREHIRWRPNCNFLEQTKGRAYMDSILNSFSGTGCAGQENLPPPQQSTVAGPGMSGEQGETAVPDLVQQLLTMGFNSRDIERARLQVRHADEPDDIDHVIAVLLPD